VRHKWAFEKPAYDEIRRKQWIDQMDIADGPFREGMLGRRPRAWDYKYRERDTLLALLRVADGDQFVTTDYEDYRNTVEYDLPSLGWFSSHGGLSVWAPLAGVEHHRQQGHTLADLIAGILYVTDTIGSWPTTQEYRNSRRPGDPGPEWFYRNRPPDLDSWPDIIDRAKEMAGPTHEVEVEYQED
jgi:hypothetical protein